MDREELESTNIAYIQEVKNKNYEKALELNQQLYEEFFSRFSKAEEPKKDLKKTYYKLRMGMLRETASIIESIISRESSQLEDKIPLNRDGQQEEIKGLIRLCGELKLGMGGENEPS